MNRKRIDKRRKTVIRMKKYDLGDLLEYVRKNVKPRPRLNVIKWMEKHGR